MPAIVKIAATAIPVRKPRGFETWVRLCEGWVTLLPAVFHRPNFKTFETRGGVVKTVGLPASQCVLYI